MCPCSSLRVVSCCFVNHQKQDFFARLPKLRLLEYTPAPVRVYGQFAVEAGTYTFAWQGPDGETVEKRARFSFTFRRCEKGSPQPWVIVEHHSSSMPNAPEGLRPVRKTPFRLLLSLLLSSSSLLSLAEKSVLVARCDPLNLSDDGVAQVAKFALYSKRHSRGRRS